MNKMFKLALSVVLGATLVAPAMAQSNFPDVPTDHWAYEALRNLKDKVLFGYPNTLDYRGNRPMSRYEFAVAADKLYQIMMGRFAGIEEQITALENQIKNMTPGGGNNQEIMAQLAELRKLIDGKADKAAVDDVRKLVGEFEKELADLGRDVDDMKKDLSDLEDRVAALEARKPAVDIHGDVNLLGGFVHSDRTRAFQGWWGGTYHNGIVPHPNARRRDLSALHEANFVLSGTNEEGPKWKAGLTVGNTFNALGHYTSGNGDPFAEGETSIYLNSLSISFGHNMLGQNMNVELGRVGHMVSPYIMKRPDFTPFYANERWDDGKHYFDGAILTFNFGNAEWNIFGGRNGNRYTNNMSMPGINDISLFGTQIDQSIGTDLSIPVGENGKVGLGYVLFDSDSNSFVNGGNTQSGNVNRLGVYGAHANLKFGDIKFDANVAKSDLMNQSRRTISNDNLAWDVKVGLEREKWGVGVGYRRIEENFVSPGSWGRLGAAWNPNNIEGFNAGVWFKPTTELKLWAKGEFVEGVSNTTSGLQSDYDQFNLGGALGTDDRIDSIRVGLSYDLGPTWNVNLSYEDVRVKWNQVGRPDDRYNWFDLNFGWAMSKDAMFRIGYIYSDLDVNNVNVSRGGLITSQVSVKF